MVPTQRQPPSTASTSAANPASPALIFDKAALLGRLMDDEHILRKVLAIFLDHMPRQIEDLQRLLETGDLAAVARQAHSIKGAAANLGGDSLSAAALDAEHAATRGDLTAARESMAQLQADFAQLKRVMTEELQTTTT